MLSKFSAPLLRYPNTACQAWAQQPREQRQMTIAEYKGQALNELAYSRNHSQRKKKKNDKENGSFLRLNQY